MSVPRPSRRALGRLLAGAASLLAWPRPVPAQSPSDRGIGGTGVLDPRPEDRGIGGTGVVGTIRRFGSIVVNDLRIGYGTDVTVTIDGRPAAAAALRLGHVVRVVALKGPDGLATRRIEVTSEVVGPVEQRGAGHLVVLGQPVMVEGTGSWRVGDTVAVSGLRRPDGVVVASRIERRAGAGPRLSGTLRRHPDGTLRIGGLALRGVDPALEGERITVEGRRRGGALRVASTVPDRRLFQALGTESLSLEAYVARSDEGLSTGAGFAVGAAEAGEELPHDAVVRAVVSATLRPDGQVVVNRVEAMDREGHRTSGFGAGSGPARTGPGGAGPPGDRFGPGEGEPGGPRGGMGPGGGGPGGGGPGGSGR